ncbi:MAG TPA: cupin domain-containing protein [Gaiellaceae bacterium]
MSGQTAVDSRAGGSDRLGAVVGQRIRRLRLQAGLGLREQARAIGIAPSSLSALEHSKGGVSLQRLQQVAEHFGLHLTDLLAETEGPATGTATVEVLRGAAASAPGVRRGRGVLYQLLGPSKGHQLQPYLLSFQPGGGYANDKIAHAGEEFAYVLQGEVELLAGDETHRLAQGDAVRFRAEEPHAFRNASTAGVSVVLGAATPPW